MPTYIAKIQIVKPLDMDWNTLGKILNDTQYETWKFANKAIQMAWEFDRIGYKYFAEFQKSLNLKEHSFYSDKGKQLASFGGYVYNQLSNEFIEKMNSIGVTAVSKMVLDKWKNDKKEINLGRKSVPNFKRDLPIELHNDQMKCSKSKKILIEKDDKDNYSIGIKLISQKYAIELGRKGTETTVPLAIAVKDDYLKSIVDRLISGEYKLSMSKITRKNKKWFLNLAYTFTPEKKQLNENRIMGIDLGIKVPAMLAINDDKYYKMSVGSSDEINSFRNQIKTRKRRMQQQRKWCGEGSIGHGTKTRIKPLQKLRDKEANFNDTKNHNFSRFIVNEAVKNQCGTIQMEDLTGIAEGEKKGTFLGNWTYYDLQQKIKYKAEEVGIKVVMIKPDYTSQRCNCCGNIHKENRDAKVSQEKFECVVCGHKANADWNAAKNIAMDGIEDIIKEQLKTQEKALKHNMKYAL